MKRHANPKPTKADLKRLRSVAREAYPRCTIEFCSHSDLGGHRAPRDHTLAFRLVDARGRYCSNVVWVFPDELAMFTADDVKRFVERANGRR